MLKIDVGKGMSFHLSKLPVNRALVNYLPSSLKEKRIKNVKVYDLDLILSYCQKAAQGANIAKSIAILSKLIKQGDY